MAHTALGVTRSSRSTQVSPIGLITGSDTHTGYVPACDPVMVLGTTDILKFRSDDLKFRRFHVHRNFLRSPLKHSFEGVTTLINLITDADLHPRVLAASSTMLKGFKGRVLNRPDAVLRNTRDSASAMLQGISGLTMPVTIRLPRRREDVVAAVTAANIRFPAVLREIGTHSGRTLRLVGEMDEVVAAMESGREYYLSQFIDARGEDGLYRKLRAFCLGRNWIVRHQLTADHWIVHSVNANAFMADRPSLMADDAAAVVAGVEGLPIKAQDALEQVRRALGLDFFGVDFTLDDRGGIIVFEANATMNLLPMSTGPGFGHMLDVKAKATRALYAMIGEPARMKEAV